MLIFWTFFVDCINTASNQNCFFQDEAVEIQKKLSTSLFATGRLILKPYKEKGHQFVDMDTIVSVLFKNFYEMDFIKLIDVLGRLQITYKVEKSTPPPQKNEH